MTSTTSYNVLIIMSDEHMRDALGCYGHPVVQTPNLDKLAVRGARFTAACTPSPICVPARASLATGMHLHQHRFWSNAQAYDGSKESWGHRLITAGHHVESIGKLHYRAGDDNNGFLSERYSMHVKNGVGWARGILRRELPYWGKTQDFAEQLGSGECDYTIQDRNVTRDTCAWLRGEAGKHTDKPWVLFSSMITPHYPLIVPQEFYDLYPVADMELPRAAQPGDGSDHPVVAGIRNFMNYDDHFDDDKRRIATASYFGLCSFLDHNVGQILDALEDSGQADNTIVIYLSDHGEMLGIKGLWTKCNMYEESVAVPMIMAGPGVNKGAICETPVSLVDIHPTILSATGVEANNADQERPGSSLLDIANHENDVTRPILSEYHDGGSITGMFMVRHGRWKYIVYPGYDPQLFDLQDDPREFRDLGTDPAYAANRQECHGVMLDLVDPDAANDLAFADQTDRIRELGGMEAILATEDYDFTPIED